MPVDSQAFHAIGDTLTHFAPSIAVAIAVIFALFLVRNRWRMPLLRAQVGAIPVRRAADGALEVLLITTRGSGRWTVPKGWPMRGLPDHEAAAREAFEEAGVRGRIRPMPVGSFDYVKKNRSGRLRVTLYRLDVEIEANRFRERGQRRSRWLSSEEAAGQIEWPGLASALRNLSE